MKKYRINKATRTIQVSKLIEETKERPIVHKDTKMRKDMIPKEVEIRLPLEYFREMAQTAVISHARQQSRKFL